MDIRLGFARGLRLARKARRLSQENLGVSGRTYVSALERGIKSPTLVKIDALARAMNVHPLTLIAIGYLSTLRHQDLDVLLKRVAREGEALLNEPDAHRPRKARSR